MKILVAAKHVIDHNIQVRVLKDGSGIHTENVKMSLNPFDEVAIEAAIQLKEQNIASEIIALSIGTDKSIESLRTALSLGVDRAILVKSEIGLEPLAIAEIFKIIALKEQVSLVLLGRQSIDNEANQISQILSYKLKWALANSASAINIVGNRAKIDVEIDNGIQKIEASIPMVISCDLRLNEPRFPSMMNIMQAKRKTIEQFNLTDFAINHLPSCEILKIEEPQTRSNNKVQLLDNVDSLVTIIQDIVK